MAADASDTIDTGPDQVAGFEYEEQLLYDTFPNGFVWGAATSAYQVKYYHSRERILI